MMTRAKLALLWSHGLMAASFALADEPQDRPPSTARRKRTQ